MSLINNYIPTVVCIITLVYILIRLYQEATVTGKSPRLLFFAVGTVAFLLSGLYWFVYDLLYPTGRMPFAANEIAEWGMFLALAATISTMLTISWGSVKGEIIFAVIFMAANAALWIAWSGEWLQDILTGIFLGCLMLNTLRLLRQQEALNLPVRIVLILFCILIITANVATFLVPDSLKVLHDRIAYALLSIVDLYFLIRAVISLCRKADPRLSVGLSFAAAVWSLFYMYMSAGVFYDIANSGMVIAYFLVYLSLRREVRS